MILTKETTRPAALAVRVEREKVLSWLALACALIMSGVLNLWNLAQNGYSNTYYSVAVKSMLQSFHNFFFASYDAGGFITVDKPPVALWIQTISAKIFGFSSLSLLIPEALAGVASVALVYYLVRRLFGTLAGFIAAMAMAITPVAVAVERGNNTDTWLMFTLLLAAWTLSIATEKGRLSMLALSVALVGVAFNIKMLEAFVVLPAFYLLYFVAAPIKWPKRILHLSLATVVLLVVSLSWATAVQLTPADQRPWVGGSQANSVFDLALNYNGLGRVTGNEGNGIGGGRGGQAPQGGFTLPFFGNNSQPAPQSSPNFQPGGRNGGRGNFGGSGGMFGAGFAGPLRLFFGGDLPGQWSWLFPFALFGLLASLIALLRGRPRERLSNPRLQALLLWIGWLTMYAIVFSMAEGIFHPYYLIVIAPAVAALVGIGFAALWNAYRHVGWQAWLLPVALFVTAMWQTQVLSSYPQWASWLIVLTFGGALLASVPLAAVRLLNAQVWRRVAPGALAMGIVALLVAPMSWAITPVLAAPDNASLPEAGPTTLGRWPGSWTQMSSSGNGGLISYLEANSAGYFYLVAVPNAQQASSLTLELASPYYLPVDSWAATRR